MLSSGFCFFHTNKDQPLTLKFLFIGIEKIGTNKYNFLKGYSVLVRVEIIHKSKFLPGTVALHCTGIAQA